MSKINRMRAKSHQRRTAREFRGINIGSLGGIDVYSDRFVIECKVRKSPSFEKFLQQAEKHLHKYKDKIPIAVVHKPNHKYEDDIVLIRLRDFKRILDSSKGTQID